MIARGKGGQDQKAVAHSASLHVYACAFSSDLNFGVEDLFCNEMFRKGPNVNKTAINSDRRPQGTT